MKKNLSLELFISNRVNTKKKKYALIIGETPSNGARSPKLWNRVYKKQKNQTKILGLETKYQKAMNDFQVYDNQMATKVQTANAFERSQLENEYKRKAYDLSLLEDDTQKKLLNIQTTFTQSLKSKIIAGINQLNSEGQFTYVLMSSSTIDIVLPVDTSLNITKQVASVIDKK